jgi:hypothetical protein
MGNTTHSAGARKESAQRAADKRAEKILRHADRGERITKGRPAVTTP